MDISMDIHIHGKPAYNPRNVRKTTDATTDCIFAFWPFRWLRQLHLVRTFLAFIASDTYVLACVALDENPAFRSATKQ